LSVYPFLCRHTLFGLHQKAIGARDVAYILHDFYFCKLYEQTAYLSLAQCKVAYCKGVSVPLFLKNLRTFTIDELVFFDLNSQAYNFLTNVGGFKCCRNSMIY